MLIYHPRVAQSRPWIEKQANGTPANVRLKIEGFLRLGIEALCTPDGFAYRSLSPTPINITGSLDFVDVRACVCLSVTALHMAVRFKMANPRPSLTEAARSSSSSPTTLQMGMAQHLQMQLIIETDRVFRGSKDLVLAKA